MNERIKLLALDAGIGFTLWDDSGRAMIDNYTPEEHLAEFAELIVRECADWIKNTDSDPDIGEEDAKALLEHFGVEL
jgi:hypothetical protein